MKFFSIFTITSASLAAALPVEIVTSGLKQRQDIPTLSAVLDGIVQPIYKDLKNLQADLHAASPPAVGLVTGSDNGAGQDPFDDLSGLNDVLNGLIFAMDTGLTQQLGINIDSLLKRADADSQSTLMKDLTPLVKDVQALLVSLNFGYISMDLGPALDGLGAAVDQLNDNIGLKKRDDADIIPLVTNLLNYLSGLFATLLA